PPRLVATNGTRLTNDQLKAIALHDYPKHTVTNVWETKRPDQPVEVWMTRDDNGIGVHRLFDPYTGKDLGSPDPAMVRFITWSVSLHDDLLLGETGRKLNGTGSILLTVLCLTGLVIWWPGISSWRRSLTIDLKSNWKLFNWHLHSAAGFWSFLLVLMWA